MIPENGNGKIYVGIPRERVYLPQFVDNRDLILTHLDKAGRASGYFQAEGHRVDRNRDRIVKEFLRAEGEPEWLLMLDTDMEHPADIGIRLSRWGKPIVGGMYFHRNRSHDPFAFRVGSIEKDEYGRPSRTWIPMRDEVYEWLMNVNAPLRDGALVIDGMDDQGALIEVDAVATGAILIHRCVLESMPPPWFEYHAGGISEDLMFCAIAQEQYGWPIHCDLSTISGHFSWVPMGQVQFRMNYENRGLNMSAYSKGNAVEWVSQFLEIEADKALKMITEGSPSMVGDYWREKFGEEKVSPQEEREFYRSEETGQKYLIELLHWNFLSAYNAIRQMLTHLHRQTIINIGAGIGTEALQLIIQGNNVLAVEINPLLRRFIDYRYGKIQEEVTTGMGQLSIVSDDWITQCPDASFDAAVTFDVLEHMPISDLRATLRGLNRVLKPGGHLYFHVNWHQQDLYPMHHDYEKLWAQLLAKSGFLSLTPVEAIKVR